LIVTQLYLRYKHAEQCSSRHTIRFQFWPVASVDFRPHRVPAGFKNLNPVHPYMFVLYQ